MAFGEPRYVVRIEPDSHRVVIGTHEELARRELYAAEANWLVEREAAGVMAGSLGAQSSDELRSSALQSPAIVRIPPSAPKSRFAIAAGRPRPRGTVAGRAISRPFRRAVPRRRPRPGRRVLRRRPRLGRRLDRVSRSRTPARSACRATTDLLTRSVRSHDRLRSSAARSGRSRGRTPRPSASG